MAFVGAGDPAELERAVRRGFEETYGDAPALVARAPGRVNLIGEHTDYNRGLVLPVALAHATYAAVAPRSDGLVRLASAEEAASWKGSIDALGPGQVDGWASYAAGVLWALRDAGHDVPGLDLYVHGTVPLGAGLSSSAALECAVALAVCGVLSVPADADVRRGLVDACIRAEREVAGAPTGGMDQTVALLASAGSALLIDFDSGDAEPVGLALSDAGLALLVTDTRVQHALVDGGYAARRADCEAAARELGLPSLRQATLPDLDRLTDDRVRRRARHIVTEIERVRAVVELVSTGRWAAVGAVFRESHASMRDEFEISCPELDLAVDTAVEAGAIGARMTGGGFGGSSIALVPVERVEAVVRAIDTAFVAAGHRSPQHLLAEPSAAGGVVG